MNRYQLIKDKFTNSNAPDISLLRQASGSPHIVFHELKDERQVEQTRKKWRLFAEPLRNSTDCHELDN